jgi:preprotein translocase subunit SecA
MEKLPDGSIAGLTGEFRRRVAGGEDPRTLLWEVFAAGCLALRRAGGPIDDEDSLFMGWLMQRGAIAEASPDADVDASTMLVAYLWALSGGVHVVTVDDTAARLAVERLSPACELLGLTVGLVEPGQSRDERRRMYRADVTFGRFSEFGYDYLRDNLALELSDLVQAHRRCAIIQRADKILRDNGSHTFYVSGVAREEPWWDAAPRVAARLRRDDDYDVIHGKVTLTSAGEATVLEFPGMDNSPPQRRDEVLREVEWLLARTNQHRKGLEYAVLDGAIVWLDRAGKPAPESRLPDGVLQVIEAREGVPASPRTQVLAEINCYDYFHHYDQLAGLSAGPWPGPIRRWRTGTLRDRLLNAQREVVYARRRQSLCGPVDVEATRPMIRNAIEALVRKYAPPRSTAAADITGLHAAAMQIFPVPVDASELRAIAAAGRTALIDLLHQAATRAWLARQQQLGAEPFTVLVRKVELAVIDSQWRNHLRAMDRLYANTRAEARHAGAAAFQQLLADIDTHTLGYVLNLSLDDETDIGSA